MSKRNKPNYRSRQQVRLDGAPQRPANSGPAQPETATAQAATQAAATWSIKDWLALYAAVVSTVALLGTGASLYSSWTAAKNYNRLTGQVRARLELGDALPAIASVPPDLYEDCDIFNVKYLTLHGVPDLFRLNPHVPGWNVGDEPIGEVRVETRLVDSFIDGRGESIETLRRPTPWVMQDAARYDYALSEKLMPGKTVDISLMKGILAVILEAQAQDRSNRWHYADFEITCGAKLVNGAAFDGAVDEQALRIKLRFKPKDFPDKESREALQRMQHTPVVQP